MFGQAGALDSAHGRLRFGGRKLETTATIVGNLKSMLRHRALGKHMNVYLAVPIES
jgi:hypothetical protein